MLKDSFGHVNLTVRLLSLTITNKAGGGIVFVITPPPTVIEGYFLLAGFTDTGRNAGQRAGHKLAELSGSSKVSVSQGFLSNLLLAGFTDMDSGSRKPSITVWFSISWVFLLL